MKNTIDENKNDENININNKNNDHPKGQLSVVTPLKGGIISAATHSVAQPFDVVRTVMVVSPNRIDPKHTYSGIKGIKYVYKKIGIKGY